jgi:hypothetical protein
MIDTKLKNDLYKILIYKIHGVSLNSISENIDMNSEYISNKFYRTNIVNVNIFCSTIIRSVKLSNRYNRKIKT